MGSVFSPPKPPEPQPMIAQQAAANRDTALLQGRLGNPQLETTPYGTLQNTISDEGNVTRTYTQNPADAANLALQRQLSGRAYTTGLQQGERIATGLDAPIGNVYTGVPDIQTAGDITTGLTAGTGTVTPSALRQDIGTTSPMQTAFGAAGDVTGTIADAGPLSRQFGLTQDALANVSPVAGAYQTSVDTAGLPTLPDDFGTERQRVEDALYNRGEARMGSRFAQDQNDLETQLSNMGITRGSAAFNREMQRFNERKDDAYADLRDRAILAGGQEASRLFGLSSQARGQLYGERGQDVNLANLAADRGFGQQMNQLQAGLAREQARNQMGMGAAQFLNQAQQQQFGQNVMGANLANQAQQQRFGQELGRGQFANQARAQQFAEQAARDQFYNQMQNQAFAQQQSQANLANQYRAMGLGERQAQLAANSAVRQQLIGERLQARNAPLNELAVLMGASPGVQQGQYSGYAPTAVRGTDVMTPQLAAAQMAQSQAQANLSGVGGLGQAAILTAPKWLPTMAGFFG